MRAKQEAETRSSGSGSATGDEPAPANGTATGTPSRATATATATEAANGDGGEPVPAAAALTDTPPVVPAKMSGLDLGPACEQCGGMMQRTGSCYTCSQLRQQHRLRLRSHPGRGST